MPVPILHVISKLPIGGVEKQLFNLLKNYDRTKLTPYICCLTDIGVIGEMIQQTGVEVIPLNALSHTFNMKTVNHIRKIIREKNIKILRSHQYHSNLYGRFAARLENVPCIVPSIHNLYTRDKKIHRRIINNILSNYSHKIITVSSAVKQDVIKYDHINEEKIQVIYNGVNLAEYQPESNTNLRKELKIPDDAIIIGNIARLSLQKGQKYIIEAIPEVIKQYKNCVFMFVGDGELREELVNHCKTLNVSDNVIFTGFQIDVKKFLNIIDIFLFPSLWEGLGNSLLEAMAMEKPIIGTDIGPIQEIVTHKKNGFLIKTENHQDISGAILYFLKNPDFMTEISKNARKTVEENFDIKITAQRYMNLFFDILKNS